MSTVTELPPPVALAPTPTASPVPLAGAASLRRVLLPAAAVLSALGMLAFTDARWDSWVADRTHQYTDDAYVRADVSTLSARVSGNVLKMLVNDYQMVKAGQPLVELDPADYKASADAAQAAVAAATAALANLKNQQSLQQAVVTEAEAQLASTQAAQVAASQEFDRQQALVNGGIAGTVQKLQQATAALGKANADVRQAGAAIEAQKRQLAVLGGQEGTLKANVEAAQANLETARLKLGYTQVRAPFDGQVSTRLVQPADYVNVGTSLISVVPVPNVYVVANYKETQLTHVAPGQSVDITVDTFPGAMLHGHVAHVAPASGSVFALLPPDNATGNFTKVVQRIPVRIAIDPGQPLTAHLRAGMSVETRIEVGESNGTNVFGEAEQIGASGATN